MAAILGRIGGAVLAALVFAVPAGAGVIARSTVAVDWSLATLVLPDGTRVVEPASQSEASAAHYFTPFDKVEDPPTPGSNDRSADWGETRFAASLAAGNVRAGASTSTAALAADAFVALAGRNQGGEALSRAMREARFVLSQAGRVSLSVPVQIDVFARISAPGETADAIGFVDLILAGLRPDSPAVADSLFLIVDGSDEDSGARTLVATADFLAGDEVALRIEAIAWADGATLIDAPGTLALLLGPLAALRCWPRARS